MTKCVMSWALGAPDVAEVSWSHCCFWVKNSLAFAAIFPFTDSAPATACTPTGNPSPPPPPLLAAVARYSATEEVACAAAGGGGAGRGVALQFLCLE